MLAVKRIICPAKRERKKHECLRARVEGDELSRRDRWIGVSDNGGEQTGCSATSK